jgi:hypothetical protein
MKYAYHLAQDPCIFNCQSPWLQLYVAITDTHPKLVKTQMLLKNHEILNVWLIYISLGLP